MDFASAPVADIEKKRKSRFGCRNCKLRKLKVRSINRILALLDASYLNLDGPGRIVRRSKTLLQEMPHIRRALQL